MSAEDTKLRGYRFISNLASHGKVEKVDFVTAFKATKHSYVVYIPKTLGEHRLVVRILAWYQGYPVVVVAPRRLFEEATQLPIQGSCMARCVERCSKKHERFLCVEICSDVCSDNGGSNER